jgi:hypothetical protein
MSKHKFPKSKAVKSSLISVNTDDDFLFMVDTAQSWEGKFPKVGPGDFVVKIDGANDGTDHSGYVVVSRRYTEAHDHESAGALALGAYAERYDFETDDDGMPPHNKAYVVGVAEIVRG